MDAAAMKMGEEINAAVNAALGGVQDYVAYDMQKAYYECASRCFERKRNPQDINNCVERCGIPLQRANAVINDELSRFQDRLTRSIMVCRDKVDISEAVNLDAQTTREVEMCMQNSIQEHIKTLPRLTDRIRSQLNIKDELKTRTN
ncbi:hypothetical protein O6H91_15G081700 [Diphasiastrum complanatum]|uniref:Uncharacterized protein n=1 Tax=Diphasiastrum complanatum TaxID=34168 RepID=A0ACC2BKB1_DIPCM|nr:hypothetical protein O6H91_15G081700 [Diphasiastrum complanatum]